MQQEADTRGSGTAAVHMIDCAVHPLVRHEDELLEYMPEPWRSRPFPAPDRYFYPSPVGDYRADAVPADGLPGSDPDLLARHLFAEAGADYAILLPLTRGLLPDVDLAAAICAATNDWLADTWLSTYNRHERYRGTIRVSPSDPAQAVEEIERWAGHPYFVQVGVPMQAHHPYGQRSYFPIWEAAARHNLPVVIHADGGSSVDFWPSGVGYFRHFIEYSAFYPANFTLHLASFIAEGVFDRLEALRVIFADGGLDLLTPFMWRMDKDWRPTRHEMPWTKHLPSRYVREHVRFGAHKLEGPGALEDRADWLDLSEAARLLLYGSNYPHWDYYAPQEAAKGVPDDLRRRIMVENARELYNLPASRSAD